MHQNQALIIRQIQMMCDSGMRLRVGPVHLERAEMSKDHGRGMCVGRVARARDRALCRRVKRPLQKVDVCCCLSRCTVRVLDLCFALGSLLPRKREDELRVLARGFGDALVGV